MTIPNNFTNAYGNMLNNAFGNSYVNNFTNGLRDESPKVLNNSSLWSSTVDMFTSSAPKPSGDVKDIIKGMMPLAVMSAGIAAMPIMPPMGGGGIGITIGGIGTAVTTAIGSGKNPFESPPPPFLNNSIGMLPNDNNPFTSPGNTFFPGVS